MMKASNSGETIALGGGSGISHRTNRKLKQYYKDDYYRIKGCLSKLDFDTEFEAIVNASKLDLSYYACEYCPHFHLTSQKAKNE